MDIAIIGDALLRQATSMDIPPSDPAARPAAMPAPAPVLRLAVPIEALVQAIAPINARRPESGFSIRLSIPGSDEPMEVTSPRPLPPGTRITLRLESPDRARVLGTAPPLDVAAETALQALRNDLPRQQPIAEALAAIFRIGTQSSTPLPPALAPVLAALQRAVPEGEDLADPAALARALANSGSFLEPRLAAIAATRRPAVPPDLPRDARREFTPMGGTESPHAPTRGAAPGEPPAGATAYRATPVVSGVAAQPLVADVPGGETLRSAWQGLRRLLGVAPPRSSPVPGADPLLRSAGPPMATGTPAPSTPATPSTPTAWPGSHPPGTPATPADREQAIDTSLPPTPDADSQMPIRSPQPPSSRSGAPAAPPPQPAAQYLATQRVDAESPVSTAEGGRQIPPQPAPAAARSLPTAPTLPQGSGEARDARAPEAEAPPAQRVAKVLPAPDDSPRAGASGTLPERPQGAPPALQDTRQAAPQTVRETPVVAQTLRGAQQAAPQTSRAASQLAAPTLPERAPVSSEIRAGVVTSRPGAPSGSPPATERPAAQAAPLVPTRDEGTRDPETPVGTPRPTGADLPALLRDDLKARLLVLREVLSTLVPASAAPSVATPGSRIGAPAGAESDGELILYGPRGLALEGPPARLAPDAMRNHRRRLGTDSLTEDDTIAQLLRYVEGALARTRVHQLTRLPEARAGQEAAAPALWIAELPFQGPRGLETLRVHVEREPSSSREAITAPAVWRIVLRLELGETGPMHALLQLRGRRVGATLWAERSATFRAARDGLEELAAMLRQQGVEVEELDCRHGVPPSSLIPACGPLLDVHT